MKWVGPGNAAEGKNVIFAEWLLISKAARDGSFEGLTEVAMYRSLIYTLRKTVYFTPHSAEGDRQLPASFVAPFSQTQNAVVSLGSFHRTNNRTGEHHVKSVKHFVLSTLVVFGSV